MYVDLFSAPLMLIIVILIFINLLFIRNYCPVTEYYMWHCKLRVLARLRLEEIVLKVQLIMFYACRTQYLCSGIHYT